MHLALTTNFYRRFVTALFLGFAFWTIFAYTPPLYFSITLALILCLIITCEWSHFFPINHPTYWLTLPLYPSLPFILLIHMNHMPAYRHLLFILFILVFSFDTGSYIIGSLWGKHPISRNISYHKTWEGFIGGYLFALAGLVFIVWEQHIIYVPSILIPFTLLVCVLSLCGDLFESFLKRRAGLKDSGTLLPGHGGFLDRFDGILFAVFFFYFCREFLATLFHV